jgi:hypothetical protein
MMCLCCCWCCWCCWCCFPALSLSQTRLPLSFSPTPLQVSVSKEHITIVGDGSTQADVEARVKQIKNLAANVRRLPSSCYFNCCVEAQRATGAAAADSLWPDMFSDSVAVALPLLITVAPTCLPHPCLPPHPRLPAPSPCPAPSLQTEAEYEKEKLNERIARLSGGVAVIQVCGLRGGRARLGMVWMSGAGQSAPAKGSASDLRARVHVPSHTRAGRQRAAPSALGRWLTSPALPHPPACLPAGGRPDGDRAEGEEAARGGCPERHQGGGGGGHCHRRRLHPAAPVPHGGRLQGHPHRRGAEGGRAGQGGAGSRQVPQTRNRYCAGASPACWLAACCQRQPLLPLAPSPAATHLP